MAIRPADVQKTLRDVGIWNLVREPCPRTRKVPVQIDESGHSDFNVASREKLQQTGERTIKARQVVEKPRVKVGVGRKVNGQSARIPRAYVLAAPALRMVL